MERTEFIIDDVRVKYDLEKMAEKLRLRSSAKAVNFGIGHCPAQGGLQALRHEIWPGRRNFGG